MTRHVIYPEGRKPAPDSYNHPEDARPQLLAADGKTILTAYRFEGVLYAQSERDARSILNGTYMRCVVDRAKLTGPVLPEEDGHADH
jgi:hypothetical protein